MFRKWQAVNYGEEPIVITTLSVYASFCEVTDHCDEAIERAVAKYPPKDILKAFHKRVSEDEYADDDFLPITISLLFDFTMTEELEMRFEENDLLVALASRAWHRLQKPTSSMKRELTFQIVATISK